MQVYAEENDISIIKIKQHFRFLCFLILTCQRKPFLGIYLSELSFQHNHLNKKGVGQENDQYIVCRRTLLQCLNCSTQIPRSLKYFSVSHDYDLLYLWKYCLMTQTQFNPLSTGLFLHLLFNPIEIFTTFTDFENWSIIYTFTHLENWGLLLLFSHWDVPKILKMKNFFSAWKLLKLTWGSILGREERFWT